MKQILTQGNIKNGVFTVLDKNEFLGLCRGLSDGLKDLIVRDVVKDKSRPLEKYYWAVVLPCQCEFHNVKLENGQNDVDWVHEMNLYRYAKKVEDTFLGKPVQVYKRTSSKEGERLRMNGREQFEFVNRVVDEEAIMGNLIPEPNENIEPEEIQIENKQIDFTKEQI